MAEPTEPFVIPEPFCTDMVIEDLGSGIRGLVFSSPHLNEGRAYQRNEVRVLIPAVCLPNIRRKLMAAADQALMELVRQSDGHDPG